MNSNADTRRPTVSFVVPALNAEATIGECLDSLRAQQFSGSAEIIVVDNGSSDSTARTAALRGARVVHCPTPGAAAARNAGWKLAQAGHVAFVDADVVLERDWLAELLPYLESPLVTAVQGAVRRVPTGHGWIDRMRDANRSKIPNRTDIHVDLALKGLPIINTAACVFQRSELARAEGFTESLRRNEDAELSYRLLFEHGAIFAGNPSAVAHVRWVDGLLRYLLRYFRSGYASTAVLRRLGLSSRQLRRMLLRGLPLPRAGKSIWSFPADTLSQLGALAALFLPSGQEHHGVIHRRPSPRNHLIRFRSPLSRETHSLHPLARLVLTSRGLVALDLVSRRPEFVRRCDPKELLPEVSKNFRDVEVDSEALDRLLHAGLILPSVSGSVRSAPSSASE